MKPCRFGVLVTHRRFGKTKLSAAVLLDSALKCPRTHGRFGYLAPYLKQAKQVAWMYLVEFALKFPGVRKNESELYLEFPNGARITLYGADNAEALRGIYLDGLVIDEAGNVESATWDGIIRPTLADRDGWCIFTGTPDGMNLLYDLKITAEKEPGWYLGIYPCDETTLDWLPESEIEALRATMTEAMFRQEMLCDFTASSDNILIPIDVVSRACVRVVPFLNDMSGMARAISVDVGRYGGDPSVIMKKWGHLVYEPTEIYGKREDSHGDNMHVAGKVAQEIERFGPDAVFVDGGRGEGVIDRLRQMGYDHLVREVNGSAKPDSDRYLNKRIECWDRMRAAIEKDLVLPNHTKLKRELSTPWYHFKNAAGKMQLIDKEKIKDQLGTSTDFADALANFFAYPYHASNAVWMRNRTSRGIVETEKANSGYVQTRLIGVE